MWLILTELLATRSRLAIRHIASKTAQRNQFTHRAALVQSVEGQGPFSLCCANWSNKNEERFAWLQQRSASFSPGEIAISPSASHVSQSQNQESNLDTAAASNSGSRAFSILPRCSSAFVLDLVVLANMSFH